MSRDYDSKGDWHDGSCATDSVAGYSNANSETSLHRLISGKDVHSKPRNSHKIRLIGGDRLFLGLQA
jgi:hypothetical protein